MIELGELARKVRRHWLLQGLRVRPVEPEEMAELKQSRPEGIPKEYEVFLRIAGLPNDEDGAGFRFWLPREVRTVRDVLGGAGYEGDTVELIVVIADYLQESWWYGLWSVGPFAGHVSLVLGREDGGDPQPPLGTFIDFLVAYLGDDACLYPLASRS